MGWHYLFYFQYWPCSNQLPFLTLVLCLTVDYVLVLYVLFFVFVLKSIYDLLPSLLLHTQALYILCNY